MQILSILELITGFALQTVGFQQRVCVATLLKKNVRAMRCIEFSLNVQRTSSMSKIQGISGFFGLVFGLSSSRKSRRLSSEEVKLVEQYRALSESDRIAMRYLVDAMRSVSRF